MKILILMAGKGERFLKLAGLEPRFALPKPMIPTAKRSILEHTTRSLPFFPHSDQKQGMLSPSDLMFAIRKDHREECGIVDFLHRLYGDQIAVVTFNAITRGNLETAFIASAELDRHEPLLILDCDNAYDDNQLIATISRLGQSPSAGVCYFEEKNPEPKWAFVRVENGLVTEIAEKDPAIIARGGKPLVGTFYFDSLYTFRSTAARILESGKRRGATGREEFYLSQVIEYLVSRGAPVLAHEVKNVVPLGTPEDVKRFEERVMKSKLRICIDMDGTICTNKQGSETYADVVPLPGAVETITKLKEAGHYVIIATARHMRTCEGNTGMVLARQGKILFDWLDRYKIPYDELWVGKPHADIFIDDKGRQFTSWEDSLTTLKEEFNA